MKVKLKAKSNSRRSKSDMPNAQSTNYSYYAKRSTSNANTGRINVPKDSSNRAAILFKKTLRRLPIVLIIVIIIVIFIYSTSLNSDPTVKVVDNTSQSFLQPTSVYQQAAAKLLNSSSLNHSKITIDTVKVANELKTEFPELNGVSIVIPISGHQPILEIQPSMSTLILSNASGSYLINEDGIAILKITPTVVSRFATLPTVTDDSGLTVVIGQPILPTASITFINTVVEQFESKSIAIQSMTLSTTPYELDVQVRGEPYYIKFNLQSNSQYAIGTYLATIKLLTSSKTIPSQYIDVRIPGRAYYK